MKNINRHNRYTEEFKAAAVALVSEKGRTIVDVSRELGINKKSLQNWIQSSQDSQRDEFARLKELEAENKFLRKELADREETIDILKKTALIFGKK